MSEFKQYTPEQEEKIKQLRLNAVAEAGDKRSKLAWIAYRNSLPENKPFSEGARVFVVIEGQTMVGYILSIKNGFYKVSTPYGIMKDVERANLKHRHYEDLTNVVIPDELKKMSTTQLLAAFRYLRHSHYGYYNPETDEYDKQPEFTEDQLKAELRNRPNIRARKCNRLVRKNKTNHN